MKKILLCLFSLGFTLSLLGQDTYSQRKELSKSFPVTTATSIEVVNKYGDVILEVWEKDSVYIEVEIFAEAKKEEVLQQLLELAQIDLNSHGSFIIAKTDWGKNSSFWSKSKNEISRAFGSDQKIQIDYKIYCPANVTLDIKNKFGDIFLPSFTGEVFIELSHGDLRSRSLSQPRDIKVSYGKAILDRLEKGSITLEFSEFRSKTAKQLSVYSRSSKIYIDNAEKLDFDSKNDEIYLGTIPEINGNFHFSTCEINSLTFYADIHQSYGSLTIKDLKESFSNVKIAPRKSDVVIYTDEMMSYDFSVYLKNGEEFASVPSLISITKDEKLEDGRLIEGVWGTEGSEKKIVIQGENSVVKIAKL